MFGLGSISEIAVQRFEGFDRPQSTTLVSVLSDGTSENNQVLQQGSKPFPIATLAGVLLDAGDVATLRGYYDTKEPVTFTDGNGNDTDVRVLEIRVVDLTDWWEVTVTLVVSDVAVGP